MHYIKCNSIQSDEILMREFRQNQKKLKGKPGNANLFLEKEKEKKENVFLYH